MSLDNLVGNTLERIEPDPGAVQRLLRSAERNLSDARVDAISVENRFDSAYKAIMQMANAALQACGYRTLTSRPGHHMTMLQSLPQTIGLDRDRMIVLDTLRKQRNLADYSGDPVPESALEECLTAAEALHDDVVAWIRKRHPEWM